MSNIPNKYYVYHIPHPMHKYDLNKGYIGVTTNVVTRFNQHAKSDFIVGRSIRKYDISIEEVEILYETEIAQEAYEKEFHYRSNVKIGWNITEGGKGYIEGHSHDFYTRAKLSESKKGKSNRQSDEHYKSLSESQKNIKRKKYTCPYCLKKVSEGNHTRWHFANCKKAPVQHTFINAFDIDGVIDLGKFSGLYPGKNDVIISGRSYEEEPETKKMLEEKNISDRKLYLNPLPFDRKTRKSSAEHKAKTVIELFNRGISINLFYEDDWDQLRIEQKKFANYGLKTRVIWVNHGGLIEKENIRRII